VRGDDGVRAGLHLLAGPGSLRRSFALATLGATLGFFVWNYPRGLVFLGDGGAYVLGCIVAELGILLSRATLTCRCSRRC